MTEKTRDCSASRRLFVQSVLTLALAMAPISSLAAEDFSPLNPLFALPASLFGGETHIPAARPAVANPARARYIANHALNAAPEGRLRLRPTAFNGL
ncbi:hypothetical protein [Rhodoblastus sp.]|uniref:hypothetical protein n=1 Tax=Rhodoblastus sp. TaxID=1962975 RepID=UPI003F9E6B25